MSDALSFMTAEITPVRIDLKRDERLLVEWADGRTCVYSISLLRTMCPCALCKNVRAGDKAPPAPPGEPQKTAKRASLNVLPGNFATPLRAESAALVGNYALRIEWSDQHASGIYSFQYLRQICPPEPVQDR